MSIRIVGISGSPRHGNTEILVKAALEAAKQTGADVEVEFYSLAGKSIQGCTNCRACIKKGYCILKDDWAECFKPLIDPVPDGVLIGAPVYFFNINSQTRAFLERTTSLLKSNFFPESTSKPPDWSRTVGAGLSVGYDRNGGQEHTISSLVHWFLCNDFLAVGGTHIGYVGAPGWQMGESKKDSVANDTLVGLKSAAIVGARVANAARLIKLGGEALDAAKTQP